jgi:hypothetical protein
MDMNEPINAAQYLKAFEGFMLFLQRWLTKHTYQLTFGRNRAVTNPAPGKEVGKPAAPGKPQPEKAKVPDSPSYSAVVTEGGAGPAANIRNMDTKQSQARQFVKDQASASYVPLEPPPAGHERRWKYHSKTSPKDGKRLLRDPAPAESASLGYQYLGDWLEHKGLCTYCVHPGHHRKDCGVLKKAIETYNALKSESTAVSTQENSNATT